MFFSKTNFFEYLIFLLCSISLFFPSAKIYAADDIAVSTDPGSIHFLTLNDNTDAILLECNGKFGMIDSGEDSDYPNGSDSRYPLRAGIVYGQGQEDKVISYLHSLGVNSSNFEFYIGTHPHSDHIGSADEIIREFHPKRVYIEPYEDNYITDSSHLWDNLYVYDHMISAAKETGATLIQYFDKEAPLYSETVVVNGSILFSESPTSFSEDFSVTITWTNDSGETETRTLTSGEDSKNGYLLQESSGAWNYKFTDIPKYTENKDPLVYTITPYIAGYSFTAINDSLYDFVGKFADETIAAYDADNNSTLIAPESLGGITDEQLPAITSGASDSLITSSIAEQDLVSSDNSLDPTTADEGKATAPAQSGIHEGSYGSISTPTFYLGGNNGLLIDIRNYGVYQSELASKGDGRQTDANNFSLGVKVTSITTGTTAFLSGDINNYIGTETALSKELGHIDLLKLGHHGSYGSNTNSYLSALNPEIAVMTGTFSYVTNETINGECGTLDTLLNMAQRGTALYATAWYTNDIPALVFQLDVSLSHNTIPTGKSLVASSGSVAVYYSDGYPSKVRGWKQSLDGGYYYFSDSSLPLTNRFLQLGNRWYYLTSSGRMATGWVLYRGYYYYMDPSSGEMKTGWLKLNNQYYYLSSSGAMVTGLQTIQNKEYYFSSDGVMLTSVWMNNKYYGADGAYIPHYKNSNWRQDPTGYWYLRADGSYPANCWEKIDGEWYYFNRQGYMVTGWIQLNADWYYLKSNGCMATGWQSISNKWYYFSASGSMLDNGWHRINSNYYYMTSSGAIAIDTWIGDSYVDASGAWVAGKTHVTQGWISSGSKWWYRHSDGSYTTSGWESINGTWYYFDASGWMTTGWQKLNTVWYYLNSTGAMVTGWQKISGSWYYFDKNGSMLGNGWHLINEKYYYMYASGAMASNTWIGSYYVDSSGAWIQ